MACLYSSMAASTARSRGDEAALAWTTAVLASAPAGAVGSAGGSSRQAERERVAAIAAEPSVQWDKRMVFALVERSTRRLLRAILPLDPVEPRCQVVGAYRLAQRGEEALLTQSPEQPEALELVHHGLLHLGEAELDPRSLQRVVELAENVRRGDVHAGDRL